MPARTLAYEQERILDGHGQVECRHFELHPPRLDFRKIENVVDEREQMSARGKDVFGILSLFLV